MKQNKSFERLDVDGYVKISNRVSFLTESEQNQKRALYVNNQPQSLMHLIVTQNSCVEFFLNFMFTNR